MKLSANPQKTPTAAQRGSHKRDMHDSRLRFRFREYGAETCDARI